MLKQSLFSRKKRCDLVVFSHWEHYFMNVGKYNAYFAFCRLLVILITLLLLWCFSLSLLALLLIIPSPIPALPFHLILSLSVLSCPSHPHSSPSFLAFFHFSISHPSSSPSSPPPTQPQLSYLSSVPLSSPVTAPILKKQIPRWNSSSVFSYCSIFYVMKIWFTKCSVQRRS